MTDILLLALVGILAGTLDILPMVKNKLDKCSIISAFVFYLILPFIIFSINLFHIIWWLQGGIVAFILALPIIILVAKEDKKAAIPMAIMSIILGTLIGIAVYFIK